LRIVTKDYDCAAETLACFSRQYRGEYTKLEQEHKKTVSELDEARTLNARIRYDAEKRRVSCCTLLHVDFVTDRL